MIGAIEPLSEPSCPQSKIGSFVVTFGYLERNIDFALGRLLQVQDYKGQVLGGQIKSLRTKITLMDEFTRILTVDESLRQEMSDLIKLLWNENTFRNSVLHGPWGAYMVEEEIWQKLRINPNNFRMESFNVSIKDIQEHEKTVRNLDVALLNLVTRITENHPPTDTMIGFPYKQRPRKPKES